MKHFIILSFVLFSASTYAMKEGFSLGIVLGKPTGLSAKYAFKKSQFIQSDVSSSYAAIDYMLVSRNNFNVEHLRWIYGAGIAVDSHLGARVLTGLEYDIEDTNFHVFANTSFTYTDESSLGFALGARYAF